MRIPPGLATINIIDDMQQPTIGDHSILSITDLCDCEIDLVRSLYTASSNMFYLFKSPLILNLSRLKESVTRFELFQCQNIDDPINISSRDTITHGKHSECGLRICARAKDGNNYFFTSVAVSLS